MIGAISRLNAANPGVLPGIVSQIVQSLAADKQAAVQAMLQGVFLWPPDGLLMAS